MARDACYNGPFKGGGLLGAKGGIKIRLEGTFCLCVDLERDLLGGRHHADKPVQKRGNKCVSVDFIAERMGRGESERF